MMHMVISLQGIFPYHSPECEESNMMSKMPLLRSPEASGDSQQKLE